MKKKLIGLFSILLILAGFFLFFQVLGRVLPKGRGALQITSNVKAKILLNGRVIGTTPVCKCDESERIDEGVYTLQLIPDDTSLTSTAKVTIGSGVLTAVDRTFLPGSYASTYTLYLKKISSKSPQLFISSLPSGALVTIDGTDAGVTPLLIKDLSLSEHEIELQKGGYNKKTIRVRTVAGYKLIAEAVLGTIPSANETLPGSEVPSTPTPTTSPQTVTILQTPTGFLRVRQESNINSAEIGRVNPGDTLPLLESLDGWYKVQLESGKAGFISSSFAQKNTSSTP